MTDQEIAVVLGLELRPASVEGVGSKMKRLADRGWAAEPAPGRFALADGPTRDSRASRQGDLVWVASPHCAS